MTPAKAKKMAHAADFEFYWNVELQSYACYPADLSQEASYHTTRTLSGITPEQFERSYLTRTQG